MDDLVNRIQIALQVLKKNMYGNMYHAEESPITRTQMFMLFAINKLGPCKLTLLAEKMEVKPSAITVMIDRLEKPGFVKRINDTTDRRSILVEVTPQGKEVLEQAIKERNEILKSSLSRLEPKEIVLFTDLLEKIAGLDKSQD